MLIGVMTARSVNGQQSAADQCLLAPAVSQHGTNEKQNEVRSRTFGRHAMISPLHM